jgi:hypothetical protein
MSSAERIEKQIRAESGARFEALNLPADWIAPNYGGRSIVNVPASITRIFGGHIPTAPLDPAITKKLAAGVKRVVLVVIDALGYQKLLDTLDANPQNGFHPLLRQGAQLVPLTSVFPSTTTAALTVLWSGYTPAEHGFLGFQLILRDYGVRANMIGFSPVATQELGHDQLLAAGLEPENFLAVRSLPQTLAHVGVPVYHLIEQPFVKSGLSRAQIRGARETRGFVTSSDMWVVLRTWIEDHQTERALFTVYWSEVDAIGHTYGPSSETLTAEVNSLAYSFEREFLRPLSSAAREGTLFLLTADHGLIDTPTHRTIYLRDHPDLRNRLVMDFAGESRAAYFYCRHGEGDAAREYLTTSLEGKFFVLDSQAALNAGLFGSGILAPEARYRIGDLIVLPREDYALVEHRDARKMLGRHGGLSSEEMLVPLIGARLDA